MFKFGKRSKSNLIGIASPLVDCCRFALEITEQDFTVYEGLRTVERQGRLVAAGKSRTMNSKHLIGHAVDLVPYTLEGRNEWKWGPMFLIAEAMQEAGEELGVELLWGGNWDIPLTNSFKSPERLCQLNLGFKDGAHYELIRC